MTRKTKIVSIQDDGRDKGKTFVLTEMSSDQAERWAIRFLLALAASGHELPDNVAETGMAGLAATMSGGAGAQMSEKDMGALVAWAVRALSGLKWAELEPLLDEMMSCVKRRPDPANPEYIRAIIDGDIDEIKTRVQLRGEIFRLHLSFSSGVGPRNSAAFPAPQSEG